MFRAMAEVDVGRALRSVRDKIAVASKTRPVELQQLQPRLVAVSKTKPVSLVKEAYNHGQRHFGENYVKELEEKGSDPELLAACSDIRWHFIGHLQRNKVNKVLNTPNLHMIETIDSERLATVVNKSWTRLQKPHKLRVMVQVNTSGEENKNGCPPEDSCSLVRCVLQTCDKLQFIGLMTIGAFDHDVSQGPNPDFLRLVECKKQVCTELELEPDSVELSMGMSNDYEHAITLGSTNVRVGSTIFGVRSQTPSQAPPSSEPLTNGFKHPEETETAADTKGTTKMCGGDNTSSGMCNGTGAVCNGSVDDISKGVKDIKVDTK